MQYRLRKYLGGAIAIIAGIIIIGYAYYRSRDFIIGPVIQVFEPKNGETLASPLINIKGKAQNISYINMNGRQIFVNEGGIFDEKYIMAKGRNIITIEAKDRFDRMERKILDIVLK